ncbi:MAG TPA: cytochrome-c oxidase, cbb3-type subunit I, partial [Terricaulis sp.]|nr:cytochrome-c oxidase, cbb3-type subunit I [Terricaulis sp.]
MKATSEEVIAVSGAGALLAAAIGVSVGGLLAFAGLDEAIRFHGLLILAACVGGGLYVLSNPRRGGVAEQAQYMDGPIKFATIAAVCWGVVGFLVGDIIAWQLAFPDLNFNLPWTNFGRLRPLHTSAV